jgi:hypothetical protein
VKSRHGAAAKQVFGLDQVGGVAAGKVDLGEAAVVHRRGQNPLPGLQVATGRSGHDMPHALVHGKAVAAAARIGSRAELGQIASADGRGAQTYGQMLRRRLRDRYVTNSVEESRCAQAKDVNGFFSSCSGVRGLAGVAVSGGPSGE